MKKRGWLFGLGLVGVAASAAAAQVHGKISNAEKLIPDVYAEIAKAEHRWSWREGSPGVKQEYRALSVNPTRDICIAAISTSPAGPHAPIQITVTGGHTNPTTIAVSPQTKLVFANHDPFTHRLFLVSDTVFKDAETTSGSTREWTAPGQGRFEFRDKLAPTLRFYVVVDPGVVDVVYPSHTGAFTFGSLPSGDYFLRAYVNGKEMSHPVQAATTHGNVELKDPMVLEEAK